MYNYIQISKACGFFTVLKIWGLPTDYMKKMIFSNKDTWWTTGFSRIPHHDRTTANEDSYDRKHWNNQYCYNRLILENSIKITKIKIMRWEADKAWLYEWCSDYTTIEYQVAIDEKAGVIEIKTKILQWC